MEIKGNKSGVALSGRLRMLADMVMPGNRLVDVGCDHGFLSVYLVEAGICPTAIAMDVRKGPLAGAKRHVEEHGLGDYITLRLSDGLCACGAGEADTLVCAGMGGRLMERILWDGMERARQMRELILQPQSEIPQFRAFLREAGFRITKEDAVFEEGKYYFAMKARPVKEAAGQKAGVCYGEYTQAGGEKESCRAADRTAELRLFDRFGEFLLKGRHPVLLAYLRQQKTCLGQLAAALEEADSGRAAGRLEEVREELTQIESALKIYEAACGNSH